MNARLTLILVALFALLAGYVYFVEVNKTPEQLGTPTAQARPGVFTLNPSDVKSVEVRDLRGGHELTLARSESGWNLVKPETRPADSQQVDDTIGQFATLQASRVLTNVQNLAAFGLVTATLEVRFIMTDTTSYALTIGDKAPDNNNYYAVYTGDRSRIFLIPISAVQGFEVWLGSPPYEPTPMPTPTATPPATPTLPVTPTIQAPTPAVTPTP